MNYKNKKSSAVIMQSGKVLSFLLGVVALYGTIAPSFAATGNSTACGANANLISAERANTFLANPAALLDQFKQGQGGLASEVRDLLTSRPETVEGIVSLARASNEEQSRAIGAGLGTAASVCVLSQQGVAQLIQEAVLKTENAALIASFTSITGDIPTEVTSGADPTGETTAGGGNNAGGQGRGGGGTTPDPVVLNSSGASAQSQPQAQPQTLFTAAATTTTPLTSVSPSR